jgi:hypothetical protein
MHHFNCPHCRAHIEPLRRTRDFFCRCCYTSLVIVDDHWVQMLRPHDKVPQTIPLASIVSDPGLETTAARVDHRVLTGPLY